MYDWPELKQAHDNFWHKLASQLRSNGINAPQTLSRNTHDESYWLAPNLLLGQTCGYPLSTVLRGKVTYLATPAYNVQGCNGPYYSSAIIAQKDSTLTFDNMAGSRLAYNSENSLSGYRSIKALVGNPGKYFSTLVLTGGHRNSARQVANGAADIAALDAVCWHLLQQHEPETANELKVIGWSDQYPALPLITALHTPTASIDTIRKVLLAMPPEKELAITRFEVLNIANYNELSAL